VNATKQSQPDVTDAAYEEMFGHVPPSAYDVATYEGKYFLTDIDDNRLLVVKNNMEVEGNSTG
jgi:hypothetical protein